MTGPERAGPSARSGLRPMRVMSSLIGQGAASGEASTTTVVVTESSMTARAHFASVSLPRLTAWVSPTTCTHGQSVTVSWSVSGGTPPYTVTVNGQGASGGSKAVKCNSSGTSQTITVVARDSSSPLKTVTRSLALSLRPPKPNGVWENDQYVVTKEYKWGDRQEGPFVPCHEYKLVRDVYEANWYYREYPWNGTEWALGPRQYRFTLPDGYSATGGEWRLT